MTHRILPALKQASRLSNLNSTAFHAFSTFPNRFYSSEQSQTLNHELKSNEINENDPEFNELVNSMKTFSFKNVSNQVSEKDTNTFGTQLKKAPERKRLSKTLAKRILSRKIIKSQLLTPAEIKIIDENLEKEFAKFSSENQKPMESYIERAPKNRFVLNSFTIGKVLDQSSNYTRYHVEAFSHKEALACVAQIKKKQDKLYNYLVNQISVRLNSIVYEIMRNYQAAHVPSLQSILVPGGLFKQQSTVLDKVRDQMPQGVPLAKLKEAFLLRAFQSYLLQTKYWSSTNIPSRRSLVTVNRSTHIDKKARDQFELTSSKFVIVCSPFMKLFDEILQDELAFTGCRVKSIREENVNHEV